jgi:hypothetical protein
MHRSGTSALARVLSLLGAALPAKTIGAAVGNEKGHWEPERLVLAHEEMFREVGSSWNDWNKLDLTRLPPERLAHYKATIRSLIESEYGNASLFVIKDPRICRFVLLYREVLESLAVEVRPVLIFRNPLSVAASLARRDGMTVDMVQFYWLRHVIEAEAATRGLPRAIIQYDNLLADWRKVVDSVTASLAVVWPKPIDDAAAKIDEFLSPDQRHHEHGGDAVTIEKGLCDWVCRGYSAIETLPEQPQKAQAELDLIAHEFNAVTAVFARALAGERLHQIRLMDGLRANAETQIAALNESIQRLTDAERTAREEVGRLADAERAVREEISRLTDSERMAREQIEAAHAAYRNSVSWKLTAPVRFVARTLKRSDPEQHTGDGGA